MFGKRTKLLVSVFLIACFLMLLSLQTVGAWDFSNNDDNNLVIAYTEWTRYQPEASSWFIPFSLLTTSNSNAKPILKSVKVNGKDIKNSIKDFPEQLPVNKVEGLTKEELKKWNTLREMARKGELTESEGKEYYKLQKLIENGVKDFKPVHLFLKTEKMPFQIIEGETYPVTLEVESELGTQTFTTEVYIMALPSDSSWSPAELHCHSSDFSDGNSKLEELKEIYKNKGYKVLYMTDHVDGIQRKGWSEYQKAINRINDSEYNIKLYPGAEMTVVKWNPYTGFFEYSDLLAYGIKDLYRLDNKTYDHQTGIDNILSNNPGMSSPSIAHPYSVFVPWTDWSVKRYRGMELMAALQTNFYDSASPMMRWCHELDRLLDDTFSYGYFASARAGGDFHGSPGESPPDYVTYLCTPFWDYKSSVDSAIYNGRTVASRYGGLGYFKITYGSTTKLVGDIYKGVPTNASLTLNITFKPVKSGTYTIKVYRDNKSEEIVSYSGSYTTGQTYNLSKTFTFPGGKHYYYLYIYGSDYIYSSPIFISN